MLESSRCHRSNYVLVAWDLTLYFHHWIELFTFPPLHLRFCSLACYCSSEYPNTNHLVLPFLTSTLGNITCKDLAYISSYNCHAYRYFCKQSSIFLVSVSFALPKMNISSTNCWRLTFRLPFDTLKPSSWPSFLLLVAIFKQQFSVFKCWKL